MCFDIFVITYFFSFLSVILPAPLHNLHCLFPERWVLTSLILFYYIPRRKSGIYWIQVRRAAAAAAAAVEISLWTR